MKRKDKERKKAFSRLENNVGTISVNMTMGVQI